MKFLSLGFLMLASVFAFATSLPSDLPSGQRLAQIRHISSDLAFPNTRIAVEYTRACSERMVDTLTRQQTAAGKNYLEIGVLVKETGRPCYMHEAPFITETAELSVYSELPLVLLELDLSVNLKAPTHPGGSTVGNFSNLK